MNRMQNLRTDRNLQKQDFFPPNGSPEVPTPPALTEIPLRRKDEGEKVNQFSVFPDLELRIGSCQRAATDPHGVACGFDNSKTIVVVEGDLVESEFEGNLHGFTRLQRYALEALQ